MPGTVGTERLLTVRLFDSLDLEVLPSRGFDIGDTWHRGIPLSWFSPVGDGRALPSPSGTEWLSRFTGGLLTTCGFGTIGAEGNGEGLHGRASHLPAQDVSWTVGDDTRAQLDGTVESVTLFGPSFRMHRTITATGAGDGISRITVTDDVTNVGVEEAPLSLLYHLNFGAPLVAPGSRVRIDSLEVTASGPHPEVPDWSSLPAPVNRITEAVFEHRGVAVTGGLSRATIASSVHDLGVVIEWSAATLPRLHQWVFPTRGRWALGIEPATAPLFGPDRDGESAGAPVVAPQQSRSHEVTITIGPREIVGVS